MWQNLTGNIPSVFGFKVFRVISESMEPELMIDDVILGRRVAPADIRFGDILMYHGEEGPLEGKIITHKVVAEPYLEDGTYWFLLKGLANRTPDPPITQEQVIARYERTMPAMTVLFNLFLSPWGLVLLLGLLALLFFWEFVHFIVLLKRPDPERSRLDVGKAPPDPVYVLARPQAVSDSAQALMSEVDDAIRRCEKPPPQKPRPPEPPRKPEVRKPAATGRMSPEDALQMLDSLISKTEDKENRR